MLLCCSVVTKCEGACTAAKKLSHLSRIQLFCDLFVFFGIRSGEHCRPGGRSFFLRSVVIFRIVQIGSLSREEQFVTDILNWCH